jgi:hypothetical protein
MELSGTTSPLVEAEAEEAVVVEEAVTLLIILLDLKVMILLT